MATDLFQDRLKVEGINFKGFGVVPKYVMFDIDLTLEAKAIYAYFCSFSGRGDTAFPCRDKILSDLDISESAYYRHFALLKAQGYITVVQNTYHGRKTTNLYTLVSCPKKFTENPGRPKDEKDYERVRFSGLKSLGYGLVPKAVMQDTRLTIKAKGIYAFFASLSGSGDVSYPRHDDILYFLQITGPTFYKHYQPLVDANYITAVQRHINGILSVSDYILNDTPDKEKARRRSVFVVYNKSAADPNAPHPPINEDMEGNLKEKNEDTAMDQIVKNEGTESHQIVKNEGTESHQIVKNEGTENHQIVKNEGTVIEGTENHQKCHQSQSNQGLDQIVKNEGAENEGTVIEGTYIINRSENQQYIQSVNQSAFKTATDGLNECVPSSPIKTNGENTVAEQLSLPAVNRAQTQATVHMATDYQMVLETYAATPASERDEFHHGVFCLFNEALIDMLVSDAPMYLNHAKVSQEMVNEKFDQCAGNGGEAAGGFDIQGLVKLTTDNFEVGYRLNSQKGSPIKSKLQYMKACIWNAMQVGKIGLVNPSPVPVAGSAPQNNSVRQNRFVNFTQRDTDYAALEKMEQELLFAEYMEDALE